MNIKPDDFDSGYFTTIITHESKQIPLEEYFFQHFVSLAKNIEENEEDCSTEISAYADSYFFNQHIIDFLGSKLEFAQPKSSFFGVNTFKVTETPRGRLICNYMQIVTPDLRNSMGSTIRSKVKEILKKNR